MTRRAVLVTGAAGGIGRAVALRFLRDGAGVVGLDRAPPPAGDALLAHPGFRLALGDVREEADNMQAMALALGEFGRLDVFVGNAGVYDARRPAEAYAPGEAARAFDEVFAVNVKGCLLGALAAREALARVRGTVIFTASISSHAAGFGGAIYVAAKHAVAGLTRQLAFEWAPEIRVNAVAPGYVPTGLTSVGGAASDAPPPRAEDRPLGVHAMPEDVAEAYAFLASEAGARLATGTMLTLDGGSSLFGPGRRRRGGEG